MYMEAAVLDLYITDATAVSKRHDLFSLNQEIAGVLRR